MQTDSGGRPWGVLFVVALLLLGGLLVGDVFVADRGRTSVSVGGASEVTDDRAVRVRSIEMGVGDILRLPLPTDLTGPFVSYRVLVVEGGEGEAVVSGGAPEHVYAEREVDEGGPAEVLLVTRPDPPSPDQAHDHLDVVYLFAYEPAAVRPADEEARRFFDLWVEEAGTDIVATPTVTDASVATFHRVVVPLTFLLMAIALVAGMLWAVRSLRGRPAVDTGPAATGLQVVHLGARALTFLRGLLLALFLPLVYAAWVSLFFFWNVAAEIPGPSADWAEVLQTGVAFLVVAAFTAWGLTLFVVQRAHRRYRAHTEPPLSFA